MGRGRAACMMAAKPERGNGLGLAQITHKLPKTVLKLGTIAY